ncbi:Uncharacterized protein family UPF0054 [Mucilaginibacter pineti]|uniref:Uncharacterized protein family UPF0054 n=1 Tax=Mucilaginibacter pineti TaxID=1391627 RepID=A0A1G7NGX9_9SPHI|nr:rRNA maturation RNAse YbeY [Mucilaginibacter pineti]SDF73216.1 Uncharacterized protein family UPF0054 [Mucilaginibacter pineti]
MPAIQFFEEDISYRLKGKSKVRQWLIAAIVAEGYKLSELSYIFCSDAYLLQINEQYLDHDTYTDVISFDHSVEEDKIGRYLYFNSAYSGKRPEV